MFFIECVGIKARYLGGFFKLAWQKEQDIKLKIEIVPSEEKPESSAPPYKYKLEWSMKNLEIKLEMTILGPEVEITKAPFDRPDSFSFWISKNYGKKLAEGPDYGEGKELSLGFVRDANDNYKMALVNELWVSDGQGVANLAKQIYVFPFVNDDEYHE